MRRNGVGIVSPNGQYQWNAENGYIETVAFTFTLFLSAGDQFGTSVGGVQPPNGVINDTISMTDAWQELIFLGP